jgi:hypothetical protein
MNKDLILRWAVSSLISFGTVFFLVLGAEGAIDSITMDSLKDGSLMGLVFTAGRAGIKAVVEMSIAYWAPKKRK